MSNLPQSKGKSRRLTRWNHLRLKRLLYLGVVVGIYLTFFRSNHLSNENPENSSNGQLRREGQARHYEEVRDYAQVVLPFKGRVINHSKDGVKALTLKGLLSAEECKLLLVALQAQNSRWDWSFYEHDKQFEDAFFFNGRDEIYQEHLSSKIRSAVQILVET